MPNAAKQAARQKGPAVSSGDENTCLCPWVTEIIGRSFYEAVLQANIHAVLLERLSSARKSWPLRMQGETSAQKTSCFREWSAQNPAVELRMKPANYQGPPPKLHVQREEEQKESEH